MKTTTQALGVVAVVLSALAYKRYSAIDPRTPQIVHELMQSQPWLKETALCPERGRCKFSDSDFWSPNPTESESKDILGFYFGQASPAFQNRGQASAVSLHKRYLARMDATGVKPRLGLFQIGPNKLNDGEVFFHTAMNSAAGGNAQMVLVEPLEPIIPELTANALRVGLGPERTRVVNAAICPSTDENLTLWRFKDGFTKDATVMTHAFMYSSLAGKDVVLHTWRRNALSNNWYPPLVPNETDLENWVVPISIQCHTPASLLREVGMEASGVDFIFLDCEGFDAEILSMFKDLPGFDPVFVIIEYGFHHANRGRLHLVTEIANDFSERGYAVYKDNDNLVFFKTTG